MYKAIIRPLLFLISPEAIHKLVAILLKIAIRVPFLPQLMRRIYTVKDPLLETEVAGIKFPNPVGLAAGFDKNATLYRELSMFGFGCIEIGTVTPLAQKGNPKPRLFRLKKDKALINRMGFNNNGLSEAIKRLKDNKKIIIGGNIGKNTNTPNEVAVNDYVRCFTGLYPYSNYFVINVSCPNISDLKKLQDQDALEKILSEIVMIREKSDIYKPVFLKISPDLNMNQVDETLKIVKETKIDGLVVSNSTTSREGLKTNKNTVDNLGNGGLTGLPIKDRSTELIRYISKKTNKNLPIIGVGGIFDPQDAIDKINAGASLVQIYTGFIYEGPGIVKRINKAILKSKR
jgi:dihydroorotate dehydrogenase